MMVSHEMCYNIQTEVRTNLVEASNMSAVEYDNQHSKAELAKTPSKRPIMSLSVCACTTAVGAYKSK